MEPVRLYTRSLVLFTVIAAGAGVARAERPQALVVPLSGEVGGALSATPARFTAVLRTIMGEQGAAAVSARIERQELGAIAGCDDDSPGCLASITDAMGVERVVLGAIQTTTEGDLAVSLTMHVTGREAVRALIVVRADDPDGATREFGAKARELLVPGAATAVTSTAGGADFAAPGPPRGPGDAGGFSFGRVEPYAYALAGGGAALVGLGAVFYGMASSKQSDIDRAPTETLADLRALENLESEARTRATVGNLATIGGGLAAAAGITLIVIQGRRHEPAPRARIAPGPVAGGFGVIFTVRGDL